MAPNATAGDDYLGQAMLSMDAFKTGYSTQLDFLLNGTVSGSVRVECEACQQVWASWPSYVSPFAASPPVPLQPPAPPAPMQPPSPPPPVQQPSPPPYLLLPPR
ncbi:hypothetical protein N2152v2_007155 [Parachlorella kessleri]